ncbi:MAG: hypothetical protein PHW75_02850 [Patescibacteria group bacterium]|nr:hypothetical protein [Patescibacteria group bacterium]
MTIYQVGILFAIAFAVAVFLTVVVIAIQGSVRFVIEPEYRRSAIREARTQYRSLVNLFGMGNWLKI